MAKRAPRLPDPTPAELKILRALWARPESMVRDVVDVLVRDGTTAGHSFNATATTMQRMIDKGLIRVTDERKPRRYSAIVGQEETFESIVSTVKHRVFGGSLSKLIQHAFGGRRMSRAEADEVRKLVDQHDRTPKNDGGAKR